MSAGEGRVNCGCGAGRLPLLLLLCPPTAALGLCACASLHSYAVCMAAEVAAAHPDVHGLAVDVCLSSAAIGAQEPPLAA